MAQERVTLEQTIALARQLDPTQRMKLRQALDQMAAEPAEVDLEMTFKRILLDKGLISEIRVRPQTDDPGIARRPVPVQGKPVSETIIEDRR
jgi:uncharacterized tellurite resistance protein B-like protein